MVNTRLWCLKAPLCWEGLNHTEIDQPGNYEKNLGAMNYAYFYLPLERVIGMELMVLWH